MSVEHLTLVICLSCFFSVVVEKQVSWLTYFSSSCMLVVIGLILGALKLVPHEHPIYDFFLGPTLPVILCLMFLALDFDEIKSIPKRFIYLFCFGAVGTLVGGVFAGLIGYQFMGIDAIKISSQLVGSYVGGGENALAVKEILDIPNSLFIPVFAVDNILTSFWMILTLIIGKGEFEENKGPAERENSWDNPQSNLIEIFGCLSITFLVLQVSKYLSNLIGIHLLLIITIVASFAVNIKPFKKYLRPSYLLGSFLFAPFFFSMGAISDLSVVAERSLFVVFAPFIVALTHGMFLALLTFNIKGSRLEKGLVSQALIGGSGTAVAYAQAKKWRKGISLGMILGVLGYTIGNYAGLLCYELTLKIIKYLGV